MAEEKARPWGQSAAYDELLAATEKARLAYFRTLGTPDGDVWGPIVNPIFQGGPAWPTRPGWQRIRNGEQTLIVSSGLSDPLAHEEGPNVGYALETLVATAEPVPDYLPGSWLWDLACTVSHHAAEDEQINLRYAKYGLFLFGARMATDDYQKFTDDEGYVGFLLGMPIPGASHTFALPAGEAVLITAKLLTRPEYEYAAAHGIEGIRRLGEQFTQDGSHYLSSLSRPSII